LNKTNSLLEIEIYRKIIEIITINRSGKNGPEINPAGIMISSIDANNNKL
tara:strand:+ start:72 stop:221 length:150 start_codon:yes stop_codon:yes gene_type:complete